MNFIFCRLKRVMLLSLAVGAVSMGPAWSEKDPEGNYYLEQMRKMSQTNTPATPDAAVEDQQDLLADTDIDNINNIDTGISGLSKIKPEFEKPTLKPYKPAL